GGAGGGGGRNRGGPGGGPPKASGKKRHRLASLPPSALLARVERRGGGGSFPVHCVAGGKLLELNQRLALEPRLLYDRPCREGYVAILFPSPDAARQLRSRLLSESEYLRVRGLSAEDLL
ncbi:hypothetical protein Agub_g6626, partial [Astrephomene gubernaculifera]